MRLLPATLALMLALPAAAQAPATQPPATQPGVPDATRVAAGSYHVEPHHTQVTFAIDHMGFSIFRGFLSNASGTLTLDPKNIAATQLSVSVPISSVRTTSAKLDEELVSADWFDAARFANATYVSTKVTPGPNGLALVDGNLTLHGVTRPVQMRVHFHGAGANPMSKAASIGFDGRMTIERSDFGIGKYVPLVSDHVELTIAAAFEK